MANRLFDRLNRAVRAFGAPDPRDISPQMQSNLARRAEKVRFREFRRTQGRPGIPYGPFMVGRTAPIPPQIAAGRISSRLGTPFGDELGRLTAPDPMKYADYQRAPEFTQATLAEKGAGTRMTMAEAGTLEAKLPTVAERERAEIAGLTGPEARAAAGEARLPPPEEAAEDREIARARAQAEADQAEREDQLAAMAEDIAAMEEQGYPEEAQRIRQQRNALLGGEPAPDRTPPGGVSRLPSITEIARQGEREQGLMEQLGFTDKWMDSIVGGIAGTGAFKLGFGKTEQKLKMLIRALKTASPEVSEALANQMRPYLPNLQALRRFGHPLSLAGRESARLLEELERLLMNPMDTTEVVGGAPGIGSAIGSSMPPPFPGMR